MNYMTDDNHPNAVIHAVPFDRVECLTMCITGTVESLNLHETSEYVNCVPCRDAMDDDVRRAAIARTLGLTQWSDGFYHEGREPDNTVTEPQIRWFVATGLQGYGPDGADNNFNPCETWTQVADAIRQEINETCDFLWDGYISEGEAGQFEEAWKTHALLREIDNIADSFNNSRASAPLYRNAQGEPDPAKWDEEVQRLIAAHIPLDITHNTRLYAWPCTDDETWADHTAEDN